MGDGETCAEKVAEPSSTTCRLLGGSLVTRTGLAQGQLCCPREPSLAMTPTPSADCHEAKRPRSSSRSWQPPPLVLLQRRPQPVLVKMGLSLCGWMSSGLHILSPFFPAPWLGPDAGPLPAPAQLIGMPHRSPARGESSGLQGFKISGKLLCEGPRVDPLRKKGQPFPAFSFFPLDPLAAFSCGFPLCFLDFEPLT